MEGAREKRLDALARLRHVHELATRTGKLMIRNDQELAVTRERVARLERLLDELRKTARP